LPNVVKNDPYNTVSIKVGAFLRHMYNKLTLHYCLC